MTNQEQAFRLFCAEDCDRQPLFNNPYEVNGIVYATNAHAIIRTSQCDFSVTQLNAPERYASVYPPANRDNLLAINREMFEPYKTEDEMMTIGRDVDCDECNGQGQVMWTYRHFEELHNCPVCDGDGLKERAEEVPSGIKTFGLQYVMIEDCYFFMKLFYKLIQAHELLGGEIRLIYYKNTTEVTIFKVGNCEIGIMPCIKQFNEDILDLNPFIK